jgi:hypothetical protein
MPYATKPDITKIIAFFRPDYTEQNISDVQQTIATTDVNSCLLNKGVTLPVTDISGFLSASEICFFMELAGMTREIEAAFGTIAQETMGKYSKRYDSGIPMFFFGQGGSSDSIYPLIGHETWRMRGFRLAGSFSKLWFIISGQSSTSHNQYGAIAFDRTARGYGWKDDISDYDYGLGEL